MSAHEVCNAVIETFAASEAALREQIAVLEADRDSWRLLAQQAIHHAADLTQQLEVVDQRRYVHRRRLEEQELDELARRLEAA